MITATRQVADIFRDMASKIELNSGSDFGGAVVIVPPDGLPIEILMLDSRKDAMHFWTQIKTVVDVATNQHLVDLKQKQTFGGRF